MDFYILPLDHINLEAEELVSISIEGEEVLKMVQDDILNIKELGIPNLIMFGQTIISRINKGSYTFAVYESEGGGSLNDKSKLLHFLYGTNQAISIALWMIKDNSVNVPFGIFFDDKGSWLQVGKNIMTSNSQGNYKTTYYSLNEFNEAQEWINIFLEYMYEEKEDTNQYDTGYNNIHSSLNYNTNSFGKALMHLQSARNTSFLPSKIASYISVLETLFVVTSANNYKTPLRAAIFLGGDLEMRKKVFEIVKEAYAIRSNYVHGSNISGKKYKSIDKISLEIDNIVRSVLQKFFTENTHLSFVGDDYKRVNDYFDDLVLGG